MPRDLVTVSQLIRETQTDLERATTSVDNARASLANAEREQAALTEKFDALTAEWLEANAAAKAKGLRQGQEPEPTPDAHEQRFNAIFEAATTPQGNGAAF